MIGRIVEITVSSIKMAMQELWKNKLRTSLSLLGITIGVFCIISVLAVVNSLEQNIQNELKSFGTNTLYLDKWVYTGGGPDFPFWKYQKRPATKYEEMQEIKDRNNVTKFMAFKIERRADLTYDGNNLAGVSIYGITEQFNSIQDIDISFGRYISDIEFSQGSAVVVIGITIAEKLFTYPEVAVGKIITVKGRMLQVIGVIKKQGKSMIGGWNFDENVIIPYRFARIIMDERTADPVIMIRGKDNLSSKAIKEELTGTMRAIRKLSPTQEDNFTLNDINDLSGEVSKIFGPLNVGGWAIAGLSLIVGMFGVANIMFVTVRERTSQIGLKKALGAKRGIILTEFLLESAFLCLLGGLIGLLFVFILTIILSKVMHFPVYISVYNLSLAFIICLITGVIAGIIPAYQAAKMNPVDAIRSK